MKKNILNLSTLTLILSLCAALPLDAASGSKRSASQADLQELPGRAASGDAARAIRHELQAHVALERLAAQPLAEEAVAAPTAPEAASDSTLGNLDQLPTEAMNNIMQFLCGPAICTFAGLNKENAQLMRDHFTAVTAQLRRHPFLAAASDADVTAYARAVISTGKAPAATHDALRAAARYGDVVDVQRLLTAPYLDVNHVDHVDIFGFTALMRAAQSGHEAVVGQLLAARGINVNHVNEYGTTALMWADGQGHAAVVARLLAAPGINVNHANKYGTTALIWAARKGHEAVVGQLLAVDRIDVNHADEYGNTALMWAARNGHAEVEAMLRAAVAQSRLSWCSVQ
jgi:ankyrin repeat protein